MAGKKIKIKKIKNPINDKKPGEKGFVDIPYEKPSYEEFRTYKAGGGKISKYYSAGGRVITGRD